MPANALSQDGAKTRPTFTSANTLLTAVFAFCLPALSAAPSRWAPHLDARALWNSNVTNSDRAADVIGALQVRADLGAVRRFSVSRDDALWLGPQLAVETTPRFDDLDHVALGPRATWQHKFGLGAFAPMLSLELAADAVIARDAPRSGLAGRAALAWQQRFNPSTRLSLTYERARQDARAPLFDRAGEEIAAELTHDLNERWRLAGLFRLRQGDVLSYATPPRPDLVPLAKLRSPVATFGSPRIAYALEAQTFGGGLALTRTLDKATAIVFDYHYRQTNRRPLRYVNHLVSVMLAHGF